MDRIRSLEVTEEGLHVVWDDDAPESRFPWFWLRDHGHEEETLHPVTLQRQLFTAAIPDDIRGASVRVEPDGRFVIVDWQDGDQSRYPLAFLWAFRDPRPGRAPNPVRAVHWDAAEIATKAPRVPYDAIMAGDDGLVRWLEAVEVYGFCLADGVPATPEDTAALARRIGYLRATIFGELWDFTADLAKADTAYTNLELRPHTDATYALDAPGLQLFHCLHFTGSGGESTLVDGFRIADELRTGDPEAYDTLATTEVTGQYLGDGAHLMATRPVFRHEHGRLVQVTFNNYDRAPFRLPDAEMRAFYRALKAFEALAGDARLQWRAIRCARAKPCCSTTGACSTAAPRIEAHAACAAPTSTARTSRAGYDSCARDHFSRIRPALACNQLARLSRMVMYGARRAPVLSSTKARRLPGARGRDDARPN